MNRGGGPKNGGKVRQLRNIYSNPMTKPAPWGKCKEKSEAFPVLGRGGP
jgi:hypothetical protein